LINIRIKILPIILLYKPGHITVFDKFSQRGCKDFDYENPRGLTKAVVIKRGKEVGFILK